MLQSPRKNDMSVWPARATPHDLNYGIDTHTHIGSDGCICLAPVEVLLVLSTF